MKFKDWMTSNHWVRVQPHSDPGTEVLHAMELGGHEHRVRLDQTLRELLLRENLVVLCGSGTSLELNVRRGRPVDPPIAPSMADLWNVVRIGTEAAEVGLFQKVLHYVNYNPAKSRENVEALLCACKVSEQFKSTPWVKNFLEKAEKEIVRLARFPTGAEDVTVHENFLRRIGQRPPALPRVKLFTTNYDLCLEKAAANLQFMVLDGFSYGFPREFDISFYSYDWVRRDQSVEPSGFIPNLVHLYKLHGSVNWEKTPTAVVKNPVAVRPLLLYAAGDHHELNLEAPFVELLAQFHVALRRPGTSLLVIGFGFSTHHLTQPLLQAVRFNPDLRLVCVANDFPVESNPSLRALEQLVDSGDPRVTLVHGTFAELVQLLPVLAHKAQGNSPSDLPAAGLREKCA